MTPTTCTLTQAELHQILDYDPTTHRLTPKAYIPAGLPTPRKSGKHQIVIGMHSYSMKKIAYLYHHGKLSTRVTQKDGNKDNYAPENLVGYIPAGRSMLTPYVMALQDNDPLRGVIFRAVLHSPDKPPYKPEVKYLPIYDKNGYAITGTDAAYVKRIGAMYCKHPSRSDLIKLGVLPPAHKNPTMSITS